MLNNHKPCKLKQNLKIRKQIPLFLKYIINLTSVQCITFYKRQNGPKTRFLVTVVYTQQ